jgi:L-alanine-DL-glutamate epimerase-like enolase superfamily enzyme
VAQARRLALALPESDAAIPPAEALLALAALDLAARAAGVPAAVLLGAAAPRGAVPVEPVPDPLPRGWVRLPADPAALRESLMAPHTLLILADPMAAGGPGGLRRLAAAARAFQVELALAPAVAHPLALAAAAQLRAGLAWPLSRPLLAAGDGWEADPAAPGFGWSATP